MKFGYSMLLGEYMDWLTDKSLRQKAEMMWREGIDKIQGEPAFWNQKPLVNQNA